MAANDVLVWPRTAATESLLDQETAGQPVALIGVQQKSSTVQRVAS
jgi:hypothetical protein